MEDIDSTVVLKEKLLAAGIDEIISHGVSDFSLRRVASACGASCAAPYKHFKNKDEFIKEIIAYVEEKWEHLSIQISSSFDDPAERVAQLCMANVRFKISNPLYGMNRDSFNEKLSSEIEKICVKKSYDNMEKRLFAVTALSAGTAALMEAGQLDNCPETFALLHDKIIAELD